MVNAKLGRAGKTALRNAHIMLQDFEESSRGVISKVPNLSLTCGNEPLATSTYARLRRDPIDIEAPAEIRVIAPRLGS